MIATMLAAPAPTTGSAAAFDPYVADGTDAHLPEQNVLIQQTTGDGPAIFGVARTPVAGLRAIVDQLVRTGVPKLPGGPSKVARMGRGYQPVGKAPQRVQTTQQFVPVPSVDSVTGWYEYLH